MSSKARRHRRNEKGNYQHGSKRGTVIQHRAQERLFILAGLSQRRKGKHFPKKHSQGPKGRGRRTTCEDDKMFTCPRSRLNQ